MICPRGSTILEIVVRKAYKYDNSHSIPFDTLKPIRQKIRYLVHLPFVRIFLQSPLDSMLMFAGYLEPFQRKE